MNVKMKIGELFDNVNTDENKTYLSAEIGISHEGYVDRCAEMSRVKARAGVDAIKLQTVDMSRCYALDTGSYKVFSEAVLNEVETANMSQLERDCGVDVFTTSGDLQTFKSVDRLNPAAHKISSRLLSCRPIVTEVSKFGEPVLMSTGTSGTTTIYQSVDTSIYTCTESIAFS